MRHRPAFLPAFAALLPALAAMACVAMACAAAEPSRSSTGRVEARERTRSAKAGESVVLALGESVSVTGAERTLTFRRVVEDSRCPRQVTCVWAGRAVVEIAVGGESAAEPVQLTVGAAAAETVAGSLRLTAESLDPWPRADAPPSPDDYRLRLAIAAAGPPGSPR